MSLKRKIVFSASVFWGLISFNANAAFKCGPGFNTYSVVSTNGTAGEGVRCVRFLNNEIVDGGIAGAYWYGEGTWGANKYRHIGYSYKTLKDFNGDYTSLATSIDIYGNGENDAGTSYNLKLVPLSGYNKINVVGWAENWVLQTSGVQSNYTSTLAPVTSCGAHLDTYAVSAANGTSAPGIRCAIRDSEAAYPAVWYGDGNWGSNFYRHFGFTQQTSAGADATGTSSDICNIATNFCSYTANNGLDIKALNGCFEPVKYKITGQWNENWTGTSTLECPK